MLGGVVAHWLIDWFSFFSFIFSLWIDWLIGLIDMLGAVVVRRLIDWLIDCFCSFSGDEEPALIFLLCFSTDILAGEQEGGDNNFSGLVDSFLAYAEKNGIPEGCVF